MTQTENPTPQEFEEFIAQIESEIGELTPEERDVAWKYFPNVSAAIDEINELRYPPPRPKDPFEI